MNDPDCVFCKIIARDIPSTIIMEDNDIMVIQDLSPKAPIHYLIMPKIHIKNIQSLQREESHYMAKMMLVAQRLSQELQGSQSFRLIMNNGAGAGQSVLHLHCHFLSGKKMIDF